MKKIIGLAAPARSGKDTVAALLLRRPHVAAYALADPLKIGCQALFGLTDTETWDDDCKERKIRCWNRSPREFFQRVGTDWMRAFNPDHWLLRAERAINSTVNQCEFVPSFLDETAPFKLAAQAFFDLNAEQAWNETYLDRCDPFWGLSPRQAMALIERLAIRDFPNYFALRAKRPLYTDLPTMALLGTSDFVVIKDIRFENEADFFRRRNGSIWHIVRRDAQKVNAHASELGIKIAPGDVVIDNNGTLEDLEQAVDQVWRRELKSQSAN